MSQFCKLCGAPFISSQKTREWCSAECKSKIEAQKYKLWRAVNPQRVQELMRRSHQRMKERMMDPKQKYALSARGRLTAARHRARLWSDPPRRIRHIVRSAFRRAIDKGISFDQCLEQMLVSNPPMNCVCCGVPFNYTETPSKIRKRNSPSIDRVENDKGYVVGNVQIICWGCNEDKSHLTIEKLELFLKYIKTYSGKIPDEAGVYEPEM